MTDIAGGTAAPTPATESRFVRDRGAWLFLGIATFFLPFAWPFGIYIFIRLYQTRGASALMPRPDIWQAAPGTQCGRCTTPLDPVWQGKCEQCGASYAEYPPALSETAAPLAVSGWPSSPQALGRPKRSLRLVHYLVAGVIALPVLAIVMLMFQGNRAQYVLHTANAGSGVNIASTAAPPCVIVADFPGLRLAMYVPGASTAACDAQRKQAEQSLGTGSPSAHVSISRVVPAGTPDCTDAGGQYYISGTAATASVRAKICGPS